jgi:ketosteroid isomerase-like protein
MTTQQIADRLVEICKKGEWAKAHNELYADNAISIEPSASKDFEKETKGLKAIIEKGKKFEGMVEAMHGLTVSAPTVADNSFAITMGMDVTMKGAGRMNMTELCVYEVKDGKIVSEQFFM